MHRNNTLYISPASGTVPSRQCLSTKPAVLMIRCCIQELPLFAQRQKHRSAMPQCIKVAAEPADLHMMERKKNLAPVPLTCCGLAEGSLCGRAGCACTGDTGAATLPSPLAAAAAAVALCFFAAALAARGGLGRGRCRPCHQPAVRWQQFRSTIAAQRRLKHHVPLPSAACKEGSTAGSVLELLPRLV